MVNLFNSIKALSPLMRIMLIGTVILISARAMIVPFLAIYITQKTAVHPFKAGVLISFGVLIGVIGGILGGILADIFGKERTLAYSILVTGIATLVFCVSSSLIEFFLASVLLYFSSSFFDPISKALISENERMPPDTKLKIFSFRYMAYSLGYAIGPLLGIYFGISCNPLGFFIAGLIYIIVAGFIVTRTRKPPISPNRISIRIGNTLKSALIAIQNKELLYFILGSTLICCVYRQFPLYLSQYLDRNSSDAIKLLSVLLIVNATGVIVLQPLGFWLKKRISVLKCIAFGSVLIAVGEIGFGLFLTLPGLALSMVVFTAGEVLVTLSEFIWTDLIALKGMKGSYFGIQSIATFGNFLGPLLATFLLEYYGFFTMFGSLAILSLFSVIFFILGLAEEKTKLIEVSY